MLASEASPLAVRETSTDEVIEGASLVAKMEVLLLINAEAVLFGLSEPTVVCSAGMVLDQETVTALLADSWAVEVDS